jgi:hypothetical protein
MLVSETGTIRSGGIRFSTPPLLSATPAERLVEFVRRMALAFERAGQRAGTVLITAGMARILGFPLVCDEKDTAFADPVRAAGWFVGKTYPLLTCHGGKTRASVTVGVLPWLQEDLANYPLIIPGQAQTTVDLVAQWQDETRVPYLGTPQICAAEILLHHYATSKVRSTVPQFRPKEHAPVPYVADAPLHRASWHRPDVKDPTRIERVSLDANVAYLAAFTHRIYGRKALEHTGRQDFDHRLAGYWLVDLEPWIDASMPPPWGTAPGSKQWLTTPTLELLTQLTREGFYQGFRVLDSWTSHAYNVLDPMAQVLNRLIHTPGIAPRLATVAKMGVHSFSGYLVTETGLLRRGHWYSSARADCRCQGWRRAHKHRVATGKTPVYFHVDAVIYRAGEEPPADSPIFPRGEGLGFYSERKVKYLKKGDPL